MTTYTWSILAMNTVSAIDGQADVVVSANWQLTGTQDAYTASITAWCQFTLQQGSGFTPYSELTEEQVIGWVQSIYGEQTITSFEKNIQDNIDLQINPPPVPEPQPLPWGS